MSNLPTIGLLLSDKEYLRPLVDWFCSHNPLFSLGFVSGLDDNTIFPSLLNRCQSLQQVCSSSDIVFSLGYESIIPKSIIDSVPLGIVNLHQSYGLKYRGRNLATHHILNDEKYIGASLHYITEKVDCGPIVALGRVKIDPDDTAYTAFNKAMSLALPLLKRNIEALLSGPITDTIPHYKRQYLFKSYDIDHEIPIDVVCEGGNTLYKYIRALTYPGKPLPYFVLNGKRIYLTLEQKND